MTDGNPTIPVVKGDNKMHDKYSLVEEKALDVLLGQFDRLENADLEFGEFSRAAEIVQAITALLPVLESGKAAS